MIANVRLNHLQVCHNIILHLPLFTFRNLNLKWLSGPDPPENYYLNSKKLQKNDFFLIAKNFIFLPKICQFSGGSRQDKSTKETGEFLSPVMT